MSKWSLQESDEELSLGRVILAGFVGHCLAVFVFIFTYMICSFFREFWFHGMSGLVNQPWWSVVAKICLVPPAALALAVPGAIIISPSLLVTLPITLFAAAFLKTGALPTIALGAPVGVLVAISLALFGVPSDEWIMAISSAAGGAAFAWYVWETCIRPFRRRPAQESGKN